jgi:transmembrane sensor
VIALDSAANGTIAQQGKTTIVKKASGNISYDATPVARNSTVMTNTIATPRGGQYQVILPDGSKAWLNAASSLTFPTSFSGDKREVHVTGEAYFEVAKDVARPFLVKAGNVSITVLGTSFDISNYNDEPIKTTLVGGAVKVTGGNRSVLLKPGQQAKASGEDLQLVAKADTQSIVAWKDGDFRFRGASIDEVMRQLSRWYDIQVVFVGDTPQQALTAVVSRNLPASQVLKALALSGYHFKVDRNRIEIMP